MVLESSWRCGNGCNEQRFSRLSGSFILYWLFYSSPSSIPPHLDDSPFFPFFCSTFSLCFQVNVFSFVFFAASPPLWGYHGWTGTQATAPTLSLRRPIMTSSTDVLVQPSTTAPSVPHLPTRTIVYTRSLNTFNSHLNAGVYVVAEFCLCEPWVPATTLSFPFRKTQSTESTASLASTPSLHASSASSQPSSVKD